MFSETEFPYFIEVHEEKQTNDETLFLPLTSLFNEEEESRVVGHNIPLGPSVNNSPMTNTRPIPQIATSPIAIHDEEMGESSRLIATSPTTVETSPVIGDPPVVLPPPPIVVEEERLGRGHRQRTQSVKLKNFIVSTGSKKAATTTSSSSNYPIANYVNCARFSTQHQAYIAAITSAVEPKSFN